MTSNEPEPVADGDMLQPLPRAGVPARDGEAERVRAARIRQLVPDVDGDRRRRLDAARRRLAAGAYADPRMWRRIAERMLGGAARPDVAD